MVLALECDAQVPGAQAPSQQEPSHLGRVLATACADEAGLMPNLSAALTTVFAGLRRHPRVADGTVQRLVSAQTGESRWDKDLARAMIRQAPFFDASLHYDLVAASFGDAGAAAGMIAVVRALHGLGQPLALAYGAADHGAVGACVLEGPP